MGLIYEEKTSRKIEEGKRAIFTLTAYTDDFHSENDEGCYTCVIQIFNAAHDVVDEYYRLFLVDDFSERHYNNFIKKFCKDMNYRDQFHFKHNVREERNNNGEIDEELVDVIVRLNQLNLKTNYSCQGTRVPWIDRPHKSNGHSVDAYISFVKPLPGEFIQLVNRCEYLLVYSSMIRSKKREYNSRFAECMMQVMDEWEHLLLEAIQQ
ncbi:hypothetical protein MK805_03165 [Shimazuella sp. AN120528]|uniref:hypothetical protein n=1 Tax=Shimazuella soli TaxID=1892854 RepID=UPI001F0F3A5E|nr:hypothetical protein [Shimazuella soli]MCH5583962.1 hypothetical protein [Shimazuella soli]